MVSLLVFIYKAFKGKKSKGKVFLLYLESWSAIFSVYMVKITEGAETCK
ncbi:hypothetical protein DaAHT2_0710 [Desulfurivibrio alkaliphilus AHT 2]|uniref:Uncharacterized protein n=1 Tax=Desulfurivibrio alkaliphilus (strain DSM 19089 / UNIQEM U267 / AHT2) TaxID=589865 RepID=D6Z1F9_DESAT|nr:hypothetical protein DaAHT2_0710 [Desulfurivibrio alkaliphilus AHT 2]